MDTMIVGSKQKIEIAKNIILEVTCNGYYVIKNNTDHSVAHEMVKKGLLKILEKKNYGRIQKVGPSDLLEVV